MPPRQMKEGVDFVLCLNLNQGEYLTTGEDVVVQLYGISGDRCKLMINAPKEIPVLRGKVLERTGGQRPECVFDGPLWHRKEIIWDRSKAQALSRQLNHIFPPMQAEEAEQPAEISPG